MARSPALVLAALFVALPAYAAAPGAKGPPMAAVVRVRAGTGHPAATAERVSWTQLVREIERTSPLMKAARAGLDTFSAKLHQAKWAYFPSFRFQAGGFPSPSVVGDATSPRIDFSKWGYFYSVEMSMVQPLYTFGRIAALRRAARHGMDVGRAEVNLAKWELIARAAKAYQGALLANELRAIFREGARWLDKAEKRMERLRAEDSDQYNQLEHLRLKARTADFYGLQMQNEELDNIAHQGLRILLSRPPGRRVEPAPRHLEPIVFDRLPVEAYITLADKYAPKLQMARAGAAAKRALADGKFAELWPELALAGDVRVSGSDVVSSATLPSQDSLGFVGAVVVGVRWNLDVPQRIFQSQEARAAARQLAHQAQAQRDLTEVRIRDLYKRLTDSERLIRIYATARQAAQGWLSASWDTYDAGFGSFKNVMDALVQFYSKKLGYLRMVYTHNVLIYQLSQAVGVDITTLHSPPVHAAAPRAERGAHAKGRH